ncbi:MAG TPA: transposase [Microvirga sp.]|nr:transposase [Microvirga sp.]
MDKARGGETRPDHAPLVGAGPAPARALRQALRLRLHLAAVRPATGEDFALVLPRVCPKAMDRFLLDFAATVPADTHAVMVLEGAGWHDQRSVTVPPNVTLVPLPAYSPELNPVERVWLYLRERYLSHRLLADYEAVVDACCRAWNALTAEAGRIKSLCASPSLTKISA